MIAIKIRASGKIDVADAILDPIRDEALYIRIPSVITDVISHTSFLSFLPSFHLGHYSITLVSDSIRLKDHQLEVPCDVDDKRTAHMPLASLSTRIPEGLSASVDSAFTN